MNRTPLLFLLAMISVFVLGQVFDHTESKYGRPRRLFLRWHLIGTLVALAIGIAYGVGFPRH